MAALKKLRLSPWLMLLLAAGWLLEDGFPVRMVTSLVCVVLHETGHALCAQYMGCEVERMELTPFGGAAYVADMEQLSAAKRAAIALAGPAVNALLMLGCILCARRLPQMKDWFAEGFFCNAALLGFNLLPAYPMDGGRVLLSMLEARCGTLRAQHWTSALGMTAGMLLVLFGIASIWVIGKMQVTLLLCGGYLCAEAGKAYRSTPYLLMRRLMGRKKALRRQNTLPVRTLAVQNGTPDARIAASLRPGALYRIVYLDRDLQVCGEKWETELEQ